MKFRYIPCLAFLLSIYSTPLSARHWHVSNLPGVYADFTTLQSAHDAADVATADTLYIEPSANNYGSLNWTKKLVIIGNGYFLGSGNSPVQANTTTAAVTGITINHSADGSVIMGCQVNSITFAENVHQVIVARNLVSSIDFVANNPGANNYILQNYLGSINAGYYKNTFIENNFTTYITTYDLSGSTIKNNVILSGLSVYNANLVDNIICSGDVNLHDSSTAFNNICAGSNLGNTNGNQPNIDMNTVFLCWNPCNEYQNDTRFQLSPGSPAIGAGHDGGNCGMFDGDYPYVLSGIPPVPSIYYLDTRVNENSVDVRLKARAND